VATPTNLPAAFVDSTVLTASTLNNLRGAFRVLQVVFASTTTFAQNNTSTYADTGLTATITPQATSNKILVFVNQNGLGKLSGNLGNHLFLRLLRGGTGISDFENVAGYTETSSINYVGGASVCYLDSPNTTSATTYKTQFRNNVNTTGVVVQVNSSMSTITLMEISA
jgi:hypothetical protein